MYGSPVFSVGEGRQLYVRLREARAVQTTAEMRGFC